MHMKIRMIESRPGAPFGTEVKNYQKGCEYQTPAAISEDLANVFITMKAAIQIDDMEKKSHSPDDYQNKAMTGPEKNKNPDIDEDGLSDKEEEGNDSENSTLIQPIRVHELADHLEIHSRDVSKIAKKLKISASHSMSNLTADEVKRITNAYNNK